MIDKLKSFTTDTIYGIRISFCAETKILTIRHKNGYIIEIDPVHDRTGRLLMRKEILIYTIYKLLFEVIQAKRTIADLEKRLEATRHTKSERELVENQIAALNTQNENLRESLRNAESKVDVLSTTVDKLLERNRALQDRPKTYITGWAEDENSKTKKTDRPQMIQWYPIHLIDTREKRKILVRFHNKQENEDRVFLCILITCPNISPDMLFIEPYTRVNLSAVLQKDGFEPVQYALPELPTIE